MLGSTNCNSSDFSLWLFETAKIGPERSNLKDVATSFDSFWTFIKDSKPDKPFLLFFDEIQSIYQAAHTFWQIIKRITQEEYKNWCVKVKVYHV
jgi:hypothetical protein